jgi:hypothetical protein
MGNEFSVALRIDQYRSTVNYKILPSTTIYGRLQDLAVYNDLR